MEMANLVAISAAIAKVGGFLILAVWAIAQVSEIYNTLIRIAVALEAIAFPSHDKKEGDSG